MIRFFLLTKKTIWLVLLCFISTHVYAATPVIKLTPVNGTCPADGAIIVNATGTTGAVSYAIKKTIESSYSTPQSSNIFNNLTSGTYVVTVYDEVFPAGTVSGQVEVKNLVYVPMKILGTATPGNLVVTGCDPDGSIDLNITVNTGTAPYTYHLKGGPTSKPDVIGTGTNARNVKFTQLETGIYSIDITDACGFQITASNINVVSRYNLGNVDLGSFELNGATFRSNDGCGLTVNFSTNNTLLKDVSNNVLFQRDVNHMPRNYPAEIRVEYPANSGNYTPWANIFDFFDIDSTVYLPTSNAYRIQLRNPCNNSDVVTSPVYTIPYPIASRGGYCAPAVFQNIPGYNCGSVSIRVKHTTKSDTKTFTWNDSNTSFPLNFSGLSTGTYNVFITIKGGLEYQTNNVTTTLTSVSIGVDLYNYPSTAECDFFTGNTRILSNSVPTDNTVPITYTLLSGPVTRDPITSTLALSPLWSDLPNGTYQIKVDYGGCREETQTKTMITPYGGFDANEVSFIPGSSCGKYQITGKGWYLASDSTVSTKTTTYVARVLDASGNPIAGAGTKDRVTVASNTPFVISTWDVGPGTYKVVFASGLGTGYKCNYIEKYVTIPTYTPIAIDVSKSGGVVCSSGYGELHVGISGGSGQPVTYSIKRKGAPDSEYTNPPQSSPDFSGLVPGDYTVKVYDGNCGTATQNLTLVASATISQIDITGSTCAGGNAVLNLRIIGRASEVKWTHPNGTSLAGQTVTIPKLKVTDAGKYMVTFNSGGCTWKDSVTMVVNPKPEFSVPTDTTACLPIDMTSLPIRSGSAIGLTMAYFNNTYQPVTNPAQAGTGIYRVVGTNTFGCSDTSRISVTINPFAEATIIKANSLTVCTDSVARLSAESAGVINPVYRWYASQTATDVLYTGARFTTAAHLATLTRDTVFYVSVSGSNYCENLPGQRKEVTVTVQQVPVISIQTTGDINNVCHNTTIALNTVTNGNMIWYGWYDSNGLANNTVQFAPDPHAANVIYDPDITEAGKKIKLFVRGRDAVCGYIADTLYLQILPLPTHSKIELVTWPKAFQEMCTDTVYQIKVKASDLGGLSNLKVKFSDVAATTITIKDALIKYPYNTGTWQPLTSYTSDITGKTWTLPNPLPHLDSLLMQVTVAAECGFYSGSGFEVKLNATSACGDNLSEKAIATPIFHTKQDAATLNSYDITGVFSHYTVTNNTNDTVTWQISAVVHGVQPTDAEKEIMVVLIPDGLTVVPDSYDPIQNAPGRSAMKVGIDQFGTEFRMPVKSGLVEGDIIQVALKFHAKGAACKKYDFYSEIIFTDSVDCSGNKCEFYSTRGGDYPELTVERYQYSLAGDVEGKTVNGLWYGKIPVKAETQFFAGQPIYIDFYADLNNNSTIDANEATPVRSFTHTTSNVPAQGTFTVEFDGVAIQPQTQLLALVHGDALCGTAAIPVATLTGTDEVCETDTAYYATASGMNTYKWNVIKPDAFSGATPVRIPLEGSNNANYINENIVRIVWKSKGDYSVWAQYSLPTAPPHEISKTFFPVRVNQLPIVALAGNADTTVCEGQRVELGHFFRETTGLTGVSMHFYKKENDGSFTQLPTQSPLYVYPSATTVYRATATADVTDCESLAPVDFTVKVNSMPWIASAHIIRQPDCGDTNGSIRLSVSGGSGSYLYSVNGTTYLALPANGTVANLTAKDYIFYVKDNASNGCSPSVSETVSLSPANSGLHATVKTTPASSCTAANGVIQLSANGGVAPYRYKIGTAAPVSIPSDGIIGSSFAAGTYDIMIMDATNCTSSAGNIQIKAAAGISLSLGQESPAGCSTSGKLKITLSGGTAPYRYRMSGKGWNTLNTSGTSIDVTAGLYRIYGEDASGCAVSDTIRISNTGGLSTTVANIYNAACDGVGSGTVHLNISGSQPLTYSIDGGKTFLPATTGQLSIPGLSAGVYSIVLKGNGCTTTLSDVRIGGEKGFLQAAGDRVYTYANHNVSGFFLYNEYEHNRYEYTLTGYTAPFYGTMSVGDNGAFVYTPNTDFTGNDSVQYSITNTCNLTSKAWLRIRVLNAGIITNRPPIAMDDIYTIKTGQPLNGFDVRKNDIDPDGNPLANPTMVTAPLRGTLVANGNGTFNYTPDFGFTGVDAFTYRVCDPSGACTVAEVQIHVLSEKVFGSNVVALPDAYTLRQNTTLNVSAASAGILSNDIYPQGSTPAIDVTTSTTHGTLTVNPSGGTFTYTPETNYAGPDAFAYVLCTNECDTAWVHLFVAELSCVPLNGTYTVGNVSGTDFTSLKQAADRYNTCGIASDSKLIVVSDLTETATAEFLGTAPGSPSYRLTITTDNTVKYTVSGAINGALVKLTGANNITIDGLRPATNIYPAAPMLAFANTYATASAAVRALDVQPNGVGSSKGIRIRNTQFSNAQKATAGGAAVNFATDSIFVEGSYMYGANAGINSPSGARYTLLVNNIFTGNELYGINIVPVDAVNNYTITGNVVRDMTPNTFRGYVAGIKVNSSFNAGTLNVSDNRIYNISNQNAFESSTDGIYITSRAAIQCNRNTVSNLSGVSTSVGWAVRGIHISSTLGSATLEVLNDTVRNLNSESFAAGIEVSYVPTNALVANFKNCLVSGINAKSNRPDAFNGIGIYIYGAINIDATTVTGVKNTTGSAIGIIVGSNTKAVSNCMISDVAGVTAMGIYVSGPGSPNIYHNSVRLTSKLDDSHEATVVYFGDRYGSYTVSARLLNNILSNEITNGPDQNFVVKRQQLVPISSITDNRYNVVNGNMGMMVVTAATQTGTLYPTLASWKAAVPADNSMKFVPSFMGPTDLHLANFPANLHVPLISGFTTDFDGDSRMLCSNAAGADNFTTPPVFTVSQPTAECSLCNVRIKFEALGGVPPFQYSLNGTNYYPATVDSITIAGTRAVHADGSFTNGTYTLRLRDANNCNFTISDPFEIAGPVGSRTLYVDQSVAVSGNGTTPATAFKTLEEALNLSCLNPGDTVKVATGTYKPINSVAGLTGVDRTFLVGKSIHLMGGYNSGFTNRDIMANATVLSGDINGNNTGNAYHVVVWSVTDTEQGTIDGFTITGGVASGNTSVTLNSTIIYRNMGGAIYVAKRLTMRNLIVNNNSSKSNGGGIYAPAAATLENSTLTNNKAGYDVVSASLNSAGSGGALHSSAVLTFAGNLVFEDNGAYTDGGAICNLNGSAFNTNAVTSLIVNRNTAVRGNGGGIYNGAAFTINNFTLTGNTAGMGGGGMFLSSFASNTSITGANFRNNTAKEKGGAMYSDASVALIRAKVSDNKAGYNDATQVFSGVYSGGGIYANNALILQDTIVFTGNMAAYQGGAIYKTVTGSFTTTLLDTLRMDNNTAVTNAGGGIYSAAAFVARKWSVTNNCAGAQAGGIYAVAALTLDQTTVSGNKAGYDKSTNAYFGTFHGGGVYAYDALTMKGRIILENNTASGSGGGIWKNTAGLFNSSAVTSIDLSGNSALTGSGGAVHSGAVVNATNWVVKNNNALTNGGGINTTSGIAITLENSNVSENKAGYNALSRLYEMGGNKGGGVYAGGNLILKGNLVFEKDTVGAGMTIGGGGAIYAAGSVDGSLLTSLRIDSNAAIAAPGAATNLPNGGGIYATLMSTLTGTAGAPVVISNNLAAGNGGAIYYSGSGNTITLTYARLTGNTANNGGGFLVAAGGSVLNNSTVSENKAKTYGGGLHASGGSSLTMTNSTVADNTAASSGGGIYNSMTLPNLILTDCSITGNKAGFSEGVFQSTGDGGGIYNLSGAFALKNKITIRNNEAARNGGGIYTGAALTLTTLTSLVIDGNKAGRGASGSGGGIYLSGSASQVITNTAITNNSATGTGGGINSTFVLTVNNSSVNNNVATGNGGGIHASGALTLQNDTVSGNKGNNGGGIYANDALTLLGTIVMEKDTAIVNGGAIHKSATNALATAGVTSLKLNENVASNGGAVYTSTSMTLVESNHATMTKNKASSGNGGGIHAGATLSLTSVSLSGNSASSSGGAIYKVTTGTMNISQSTLDSNTAGNGGAIHTMVATTANLNTIVNSTFSRNKATAGNGGAISASATTSAKALSVTFSTFNGNSASTDAGHAIHYSTSANQELNGNIIYGNGSTGTGTGVYPITSLAASYNIFSAQTIAGTGNRDIAAGEAANIFVAIVSGDTAILADNSGPTQTIAIKQGGYAHNLIPTTTSATWGTIPFDQRGTGFTRSKGCKTDAGSFEIQLVDLPFVVDITGPNESCTGDRITYRATTGLKTYQWELLAGGVIDGSSTAATTTIVWGTAVSPPLYNVKVTATDINNCDNSISMPVTVKHRTATGPLYRIPNE